MIDKQLVYSNGKYQSLHSHSTDTKQRSYDLEQLGVKDSLREVQVILECEQIIVFKRYYKRY